MEAIKEKQNTRENLVRLSAQRFLYADAKRLIKGQYIAVTIISALGVASALTIGLQVSIVSFIFTLVDTFLIDRIVKAKLKDAALIQEEFDCDVLELEWSKTKCQGKVPYEEIEIAANKMPGDPWTQKLVDWYPSAAFDAPLAIRRLICQRANVVWNLSGRRRVSFVVDGLAILCFIGLAISLFLFKGDATKWFLGVLVPTLPFLNRLRDVWFKTRDSISRVSHLQSRIQEIWTEAVDRALPELKLTERSREFQNELFDFRSREIPVFDQFYWKLRDQNEKAMETAAEGLLAEARTKGKA